MNEQLRNTILMEIMMQGRIPVPPLHTGSGVGLAKMLDNEGITAEDERDHVVILRRTFILFAGSLSKLGIVTESSTTMKIWSLEGASSYVLRVHKLMRSKP